MPHPLTVPMLSLELQYQFLYFQRHSSEVATAVEHDGPSVLLEQLGFQQHVFVRLHVLVLFLRFSLQRVNVDGALAAGPARRDRLTLALRIFGENDRDLSGR